MKSGIDEVAGFQYLYFRALNFLVHKLHFGVFYDEALCINCQNMFRLKSM